MAEEKAAEAPAAGSALLGQIEWLQGRCAQLETAIRWALGEIPAQDGKWFGEVEDAERMMRAVPSMRRRYWWRRRLRMMAEPLPEEASGASARSAPEAISGGGGASLKGKQG